MRGNWDVRAHTVVAFVLRYLGLAGGRRSADVSTAIFGGTRHLHSPLAVLQANVPDSHGTPLPRLKIFGADPNWANKVTRYMARTGADANGICSALDHVRHMSWAAGRTLKSKVVVLLALAEDGCSEGNGRASCRLTRAVSAASKHTSDAHFILVANGFEVEPMFRADMESELKGEGWRSLTFIQTPEFEGFSSAINRAMNAVPEHSVVAVLSTSATFLPSGTADLSTWEDMATEDVNGDANSNYNGGSGSTDVFVAYERLKSNLSLASTTAFEGIHKQPWLQQEVTGGFCSRECGDHASASSRGMSHDKHGNIRLPSKTCTHVSGLLVTARPARLQVDRQGDDADDAPTLSNERGSVKAGAFQEEKVHHVQDPGKNPEANDWASSIAGPSPPPSLSSPDKLPVMRLGQMASLPLLVFDKETYFNLGKLDERFAFQGGIAEWISRAKMTNRSQIISGTSSGTGGCPCPAFLQRRSESVKGAAKGTGLSILNSSVRHLHEDEWSKRFVRYWSDEGIRADDDVQPSNSTAGKGVPLRNCPQVGRVRDDGQEWGVHENVHEHEGLVTGGLCRMEDAGNYRRDANIVLDQRNRLSPEKLEALVQADADMYFLPLLLKQPAPDPASNDNGYPRASFLEFNSKWMERAPDKLLVRSALIRRKQFPVAMVVVVLDDTSLLCAALEEVAVVVEHVLVVISNIYSNGSPKDNSRLLDRLNLLLEDIDSSTHAKLRVEVGSWATEREQREYGNTIVREDSRSFSRVVVMDTGEFWHPVELARALAIAHQHPEAKSLRAGVRTHWARVRSVDFPPDMPHDVWLIDPHSCVWDHYREIICEEKSGDAPHDVLTVVKSIGVIRHLSHHEERHDSEQLQLRSVSGTLAAVDVNEWNGDAAPLWASHSTSDLARRSELLSADAVWIKLSDPAARPHGCGDSPCREGKQIHADWTDLGQELYRVEGATVVRRPDLASNIAPANSLDFVKAFQAYFGIFKSSLFPIRTMLEGHMLEEVEKIRRFVDAVARGDSSAARHLSTYYTDVIVPKPASDGYENTPTLVSMGDVFINGYGYVWNKKVFVIAQYWGYEYFHFMVEALPRIAVALDVLQENLDVKVAVRGPPPDKTSHTQFMCELLELLGIGKERVIFIKKEIHADLAILPSSVPCWKPDTQSINMLRRNLLQAMYPSTEGVPPPVPRPVIVLIVRDRVRGLKNNEKVREALKQGLPSYDVVEFRGTGPSISQLQIFATASLIVAPHGAGLSNIIVSPLHTPILEIGPPDCSTCFLHLAVKLQHIYGRHTGDTRWTTPCGSWYEPDVNEILLLIRDLFEAKRHADAADPSNIADFQS